MTRKAVFAGSFDPITNGHIDLIERSRRLFDEVTVLIAVNTAKQPRFTTAQRVYFVQEAVQSWENVQVAVLEDELLVQYCKRNEIGFLVRGIRNATDSDYESSIASANYLLNPAVETVVLYARDEHRYLSSSIVKEIAKFNGDISAMVPLSVQQAFLEGKEEAI